MIQLVEQLSVHVEASQLTPAALSLPVLAQKPTVPPTHEIFGLAGGKLFDHFCQHLQTRATRLEAALTIATHVASSAVVRHTCETVRRKSASLSRSRAHHMRFVSAWLAIHISAGYTAATGTWNMRWLLS